MNRICFITRNYKDTNSAGNKAKTDMENILISLGATNLGLQRTFYKSHIIAFFLNLCGIIKASLLLSPNDRLVLQYPLKKYYTWICRIAHLRNAKVITLVHDLGSFRRRKLTIPQEIKRLSNTDYIIALNSSMKKWLEEHGCQQSIGTLDIWDYLSNQISQSQHQKETKYRIIYAGTLNLRKNTFLVHFPQYINSFDLALYGNGNNLHGIDSLPHISYHGFIKSDELIASVQADFGLVWDGESLDGCTGSWGEYLKYNNPHKTSLYIRCGLPIIIWKGAALAQFIEQEQIGICITSLTELDSILSMLTEDEYRILTDVITRDEAIPDMSGIRFVLDVCTQQHNFLPAMKLLNNCIEIYGSLPQLEEARDVISKTHRKQLMINSLEKDGNVEKTMREFGAQEAEVREIKRVYIDTNKEQSGNNQ